MVYIPKAPREIKTSVASSEPVLANANEPTLPTEHVLGESEGKTKDAAASGEDTDIIRVSANTNTLRANVCEAITNEPRFGDMAGDSTINLIMRGIGAKEQPKYGLLLLKLIRDHSSFFTEEATRGIQNSNARDRAIIRINNAQNAIDAKGDFSSLGPQWERKVSKST